MQRFFKMDKSDIPNKYGNECSGESLLFEAKTEKLGEMWNAFATLNRLSLFSKIKAWLENFFSCFEKKFSSVEKSFSSLGKNFSKVARFS